MDGTEFEVVRASHDGITVRSAASGGEIVFSIATNGGPRELVLVSGQNNPDVNAALAFARREAEARSLI